MKDEKDAMDPAEGLGEDVVRKAEDMCRSLSSSLSIDKRGEAAFYNGAFTDLDSLAHRQFPVTVADIGGQPWLTVISDTALPATGNGLLVFNVPPSDSRRYVGRMHAGRPGRREVDAHQRSFALFDILRDVRRR